MSGQAFRSLVALAILISSTACDNVEWGGVEVRFVRPPAALDGTTPDDSDGKEEPDGFTLPPSAALYMGTLDSAGIYLAAEVIPQIGASWPSSLVAARGDLHALRTANGQPAVSTTFMFRDRMRIQPAEARSYSLYLLATSQGGQYGAAYVWYREAAREGKGTPRYLQELDWDGDGKTELLLEVVGERSRWTAVVEERDDEWTRTFENACGAGAAPVPEPAPG